jgi:hypothetical protein
MVIHKYTDTWGGKNYGCYPIHIPGKTMLDELDQSLFWKKFKQSERIDKRNDNQIDIHRGSESEYLHTDGEKRIYVFMSRSRSGKTVDWEFHCNFSGPIET